MTQVSQRVLDTDPPCIVKTKRLMAGQQGVLSLAQGIVHWQPPPASLETAARLLQSDASINGYGPAEGLPALRAALREKVRTSNKLGDYNVMVTAGANQAFVNLVLALCDQADKIVLFRPYYFNHTMAVQMTGGSRSIVYGDCMASTLHPDLDWLEREMAKPNPPKMVVLVNPCNPTGVLMTQQEVQRAAEICGAAGAWLILDNTYEDFVYDGRQHHTATGDHVIHVFSFSKAYGMMGWRVGYIAYPDFDGSDALGQEILKVQDTIPICATQLSQHIALEALQSGGQYVKQEIQSIIPNQQAVLEALSPLGSLGQGVAGGEGAIYLWARLPGGCDDDELVVEWLIKRHGVCVIPGTACGAPGYIRVAYANLKTDACQEACQRLKAGLQELAGEGVAAVTAWREAAKAAVV